MEPRGLLHHGRRHRFDDNDHLGTNTATYQLPQLLLFSAELCVWALWSKEGLGVHVNLETATFIGNHPSC